MREQLRYQKYPLLGELGRAQGDFYTLPESTRPQVKRAALVGQGQPALGFLFIWPPQLTLVTGL